MKKRKLIKILASSLGVGGIAVVSATTVISCGSKQDEKLTAFIKAAKAETANNIVKNATPQAANWSYLIDMKDDLKISDTSVKGKVVTITITSASKAETAIFKATYVDGATYKVGDWKCSTPPASTTAGVHSWDEFLAAAKKETSANIIKNSHPPANTWTAGNTFLALTDAIPNVDKKTVTFTIANRQQEQSAQFVSTYTNNRIYQDTDWSLGSQPASDKAGLTFSKQTLPSADSQASGGNVTVKIDNTYYLGAQGGLWSSPDHKTWKKVKLPNFTDLYRVTAITKSGDNIFVGTDWFGPGTAPPEDNGFNHLYVSTDKGLTFNNATISDTADGKTIAGINAMLDVKGILYVGTQYGMWLDETAGTFTHSTAFNAPTTDLTATASQSTITQIILQKNGNILVGTDDNSIFMKTPSGDFTGIRIDGDTTTQANITFINQVKNGDIYLFASGTGKAADKQIATGLYKSTDKGVTWNLVLPAGNDGLVGRSIIQLNTVAYLSTNQGLYISDNEGKDFKINDTLGKGTDVKKVVKMDHTIYAATTKGLLTSAGFGLNYFTSNKTVPVTANINNIQIIGTDIFINSNLTGFYINS